MLLHLILHLDPDHIRTVSLSTFGSGIVHDLLQDIYETKQIIGVPLFVSLGLFDHNTVHVTHT